jgi:hypothetical protein
MGSSHGYELTNAHAERRPLKVSGPDNLAFLRGALAPHRRGAPGPTPDCVDDDTLAALAEGTLAAEDRADALGHVASCARCRGIVASIARAVAEPRVAREVRALERRPWRALGGWAAGIAAAAALLLVILPIQEPEPAPHRSPPITAASAPEAVRPSGPVADASSLRWTPVAGADRYRVALFDAQGGVLFQTEVEGTVAVLPDSALPSPGGTYWWQVEARVGFDRWVASELIEFSVAGGRGR